MQLADHEALPRRSERIAGLRVPRAATALLHRGWSAHALAFAIAGIAASVAWPALLKWIVSLWQVTVPLQTSVQPVLARGKAIAAAAKALLVAPLLENLLLLVLVYLLQMVVARVRRRALNACATRALPARRTARSSRSSRRNRAPRRDER